MKDPSLGQTHGITGLVWEEGPLPPSGEWHVTPAPHMRYVAHDSSQWETGDLAWWAGSEALPGWEIAAGVSQPENGRILRKL